MMEEYPDFTKMHEQNRRYRMVTIAALVLAAVAFFVLYRYPLLRTYQSWNSQHGYNSNGLIIFLGSAWLLFAARKSMKAASKAVSYFGLVFLIFGFACTLGLKRADFNAAQTVFCLFCFWAAILYLGGWKMASFAIFPLFIMLFSVQWGLGSSIISTHLRIHSTDIACRFINFTGKLWNIQVIRQGTNVSLVNVPDVQFDVAAPCSGLQSLIMTSVLCLVMAYFYLKTWWKRIVMVLLIAPIAVLNNSLRIVLIAYCGSFFTFLEHKLNLSEGWGRNVAFGAFHEYPGVVVYTLGFIMIFVACSILERLPGVERQLAAEKKARKQAEKEAKSRGETPPPEEDVREDFDEGQASPYYAKIWKHALVVLALTLITLFLAGKVKENIRYTPGLAYATIPYMVTGDGLTVKMLPIITNIPLQTESRIAIPVPVSELELKELPEDTVYFRAYYVPKKLCASYDSVMNKLFSNTAKDEERYQAIRDIDSKTPFDGVSATQLVMSASFWRSNIVMKAKEAKTGEDMMRVRQQTQLIRGFALIQLVQMHRAPESPMLAIVQNDKDHHSIHAPEACFPSQGWTIDEPTDFPLTLGETSFDAARMDVSFIQANIRETIIYWYQCDHKLHNASPSLYATRKYMWLPFKTTLDLVFKGLGDRWAFIRFSDPVLENESYDDGAARIKELINELEPYLTYEK
ncbi:exosortase/archaeosortase family protein [bacterium]|nr:exosortase/archaeosortase family protein [bacterium]